jgi:oxygen-independent coproporphyrinogen-3 oxidase
MNNTRNEQYQIALDELDLALKGDFLPTYIYSYPPKRSYRELDLGTTVRELWANDHSDEINIYLHIPFCRYRCTFCTLFLTTRHDDAERDRYVDALVAQIRRRPTGDRERFVKSVYFGGGTPALLTPSQFDRIMAALRESFPSISSDTEVTMEGTPDAFAAMDLAVLRGAGVNRLSIGLQTLDPEQLRRSGRPYSTDIVAPVIKAVAAAGINHLNLDLIYGMSGEGVQSWVDSLEGVLDFSPTTLSLYPVVVRPESTLDRLRQNGRAAETPEKSLYELYDIAEAILTSRGYRQESFTRFTKAASGYLQEESDFSGTPLIGFGAGARSYTSEVHYSTDYAVARKETSDIIAAYIECQLGKGEELATHGIALTKEERQRRFAILNMTLGRMCGDRYRSLFGGDLRADFARELDAMIVRGCATIDGETVRLTSKGYKMSSAIGKLFFTGRVEALERAYVGR